MKLWLMVLVIGVLGMQVIGCKAKGEVGDNDSNKDSMKVKVDTK
jgi:hypothetical protein